MLQNKQLNFKFSLVILIIVAIIAAGVIGYFTYKTDQDLNKTDEMINPGQFLISAGVVPHHLVAKDLIEDFFAYIAFQGKPETIILLSPDHFQTGSISGGQLITLSPQTENFHGLEVDYSLIKALVNPATPGVAELVFSDSAVNLDHGITNLVPFIKKYLPDSKIVPFIIPANVSLEETEQFSDLLNSLSSPETIVIASVDFSHYLSSSAASFHDVKSKRVLINFKKEEFENIEVDSWQALYIAREFARLRKKEFPQIIGQGHSSPEETTSYFSVVFEETSRDLATDGDQVAPSVRTILFVGDIMLDRNVEGLISKNNPLYPFQKIGQLLRGVDLVVGNLEGPIVAKPLKPIPHTMVFSFPPEAAEALSLARFNLLSLANNHGLDMGRSGPEETRKFLREKSIAPLGNPGVCNGDFSYDFDKGIRFFALNKVYNPLCKTQEMLEAIESARAANPDLFIIVSVHWGQEYKLVNSSVQRKLAEQLINAGADLIIGHHPHVVQNIDMYKGKLIFYSLGNFVFDQYFSEQTQQGLAVGLEIWPKRLVFRLFPVKSEKSQPALMIPAERKKFLENLAQRSAQDLSSQIKNGIIEVESVYN